MNQKFKDATKLIKSRVYILVTDKDASMSGDFRGFSAFMKLHSLKLLHENTAELIRELQTKLGKGKSKSGKRKATTKKKATTTTTKKSQ